MLEPGGGGRALAVNSKGSMRPTSTTSVGTPLISGGTRDPGGTSVNGSFFSTRTVSDHCLLGLPFVIFRLAATPTTFSIAIRLASCLSWTSVTRAVSAISSARSATSRRWASKNFVQASAALCPAARSAVLHSLSSSVMADLRGVDSLRRGREAFARLPGTRRRLAIERSHFADLDHVHRHAFNLCRQGLVFGKRGCRNFPCHVHDHAPFPPPL